MLEKSLEDTVQKAERFYSSNLKEKLEKSHLNYFVAIEPISGDYFLGKKIIDVSLAAKKAYPDRMSHVIRIGHAAAVHIGVGQ